MVIPNDGPSDNAWGVDLADPVLVSHQQLLVLFARERDAEVGTLYFRVLDPSAASTGDDLGAWNGWYRYRFPEAQAASLPANAGDVGDIPGRELRLGGMALITVPPEAEPVASADAAFRVLSEGSFLSIYRQSAGGTVLLSRVGLLARSEDEEGVKVPRYALEPAWEVRFRRSGLRDVPLDRTDGQSYLDPVNDPFYEPTVELARITGVSGGRFDVARVPSAVPEQSSLYLAVATADGVDLHQVRQSGHALVDYSDAPIAYPPLQPTLRADGTPLTPIPGLAPALVFYAEQEEATGPDGQGAELQRAGHLMLAIPVRGGGLAAAVALYDFALDRDGNIPVLPPQAQSVVLVDGTLVDGRFTPDTTAAHYPQSADLAATVQVVDRLVVSSMVLGQVQPTRTPTFHFGDDGLVHLYYGGPPPTPPFDRWSSLDPSLPQAMVAQFDARANRLVLSVPWQETETEEQGNGVVDFVALQSGCTMTGAAVAVTDGRLGDGPPADDRCNVRITYPPATTLPAETWLGVPRSLGPFMDVLNGAASGDSADPDVLAGTQPFYDCSGRLPLAHLPLVLPSGVGAGPAPKVTVVSTRADLGLTSVTVTASGATQDYAFLFGDAAGASVKVTWRGVPIAVAAYRDVFDGAAAAGTYAYPPDVTATSFFALGTDAVGVPAPVVLYPTGGTTDVTTIAVASGAADTLDATFARPGGDVPIAGLPAGVDEFVAQLRADPQFQALHLGISGADAGGHLVPTPAPVGPMDLASTGALFDVLVPGIDLTGATVKVGPYPAGRQGHTFDPPQDETHLAGVFDPTRMVGFLATSVRPGTGATAYVLNRAPTEVEPSRSRSLHGKGDADPLVSGVWIRQPAHWQCGFTPATNATVPVVANGHAIPASTNLRPQRDWTLEAWVRPDVGKRQRLLTFLDDKTPVADGAPKLAYAVSLESQQVVCGQSYAKTPGNPDSSYFQTLTSEQADFMPAGGFTWEFWVKPDAQAGPPAAGDVTPIGGVIQVGALDSTPFLTVGLTADRHVQVATVDGNGTRHTVTSDDTLPAADWSHLSLTGEQQPGDKTWTLTLMIDADVDKTWASVSLEQQSGAFLTIGANTPDDATVFGRIAQLRYWSHARSAADIRRTWLTSVSGSESGLLGNWPLSDIEDGGNKGRYAVNTALITGTDWDASLYLFKHQVLTTTDDSFFLSTVASVGGLPAVEADTLLANGRWNHLALVYQAGGGLAMNPAAAFDQGRRDWLDCGRADAVGTRGRFAIDTWLRVDKSVQGPLGTIMARWDDPEDAGNRSFTYGLDETGEMNFSMVVVADTVGTTEVVGAHSTGAALRDGVTHHVAVVVSWETAADPATGIGWTITFHKDGAKVGGASGSLPKVTSLQVQSSRNDLTIGCAFAPVPGAAPMPEEGFSYLRATLGRTRVWAKAPELEDLFPERYPRLPTRYAPDGLAVQWSFREQSGRVSVDDIGGLEAKLSTSAMRTALADTSTLTFVANGAWVGRITPADTPLEPASAAQFTFGAPLGASIAGLQGDIAQVALFDEARSVETIQDQMYVPRWGDATSLIACWNFSRGGADITGGQNDIAPLLPDTRLQPSTAPLSIEGPYVRNVYGGVVTDHSQSAPGRIAVGSYADAQDVGTARQRAVLKRQYVVDPDQTVARALQIGELGLTYLGQVQTNPTLIGYIEGAPPVPSENLTRPYYLSGLAWAAYLDTATVTLVQEAADTVTFTSSSSWATGVELSGAFGLMSKSTEAVIFGLPGIGVWSETLTSNFKVQAVAKASIEVGGGSGSSIQSVWGATQRDTMGVNGDWEPRQTDPERYLDPAIGRRFVVDNGGYALVQSLTADLYALTFRATGAAVGTIILPNPAIPPDRNIIVFPMNNQYTKNGTLDGKVGLADDPAYTDADERRRSLFRPVEAYALAGQIDRQQQRARSVADQFDPERKAHGWDTGLDDARAALSQDFSSRSADAVSVATPVQGLVNRYVWTADGGLHTEEQAEASTSTHSYTGEIARGGGGGFHGEGEYYFKLGVAWSFDVMATHRVDVSVSKQVTSQQALHLDVKVAGEALLRTYDPTAEGEYPPAKGAFLPGSTPGKVRNYRFMTFYLPPASPNSIEFTNIVDPVWLRMSNDHNARALRQLDASSPTWRVLHRVTYVERIPPPVASRPLYTPARAVVAPVNVEGNADLIRLVDAQIPASVTERTRLIVGNAVATTLNPAPNADHTYPKSALEQVVPWWGEFLDRARPVGGKPLAEAHAEAAAVLHALVSRTTAYLYDGYSSGAFDAVLD